MATTLEAMVNQLYETVERSGDKMLAKCDVLKICVISVAITAVIAGIFIACIYVMFSSIKN